MNILDEIVENRKILISKEKEFLPLKEIIAKANEKLSSGYKPIPFKKNYNKNNHFLIAEIKKASPSKGLIRENFNVKKISTSYHNSKYVSAISVLTEPDYFKGSYDNLKLAATPEADTKLPLLMKDFIIDEYQIYKGFLEGASAILFISSILNDKMVSDLKKTALSLGLSILFESHDDDEYRRGIDLGMNIIGINNRNLKTFKTDINISRGIVDRIGIPNETIVISESGISTHNDILKLSSAGVNGFLVGEFFMRSDDIEKKIEWLMTGK